MAIIQSRLESPKNALLGTLEKDSDTLMITEILGKHRLQLIDESEKEEVHVDVSKRFKVIGGYSLSKNAKMAEVASGVVLPSLMSYLFWNCQGLGILQKVPTLQKVFSAKGPMFVFL